MIAFARFCTMRECLKGQACKAFSSGVATNEIKKNGNFKLASMLNLKLKKNAATPAKKGINPFAKEPCVFKAKPASKTVGNSKVWF